MGRHPMKDVLGNHFKGPIIPFGSLVEYHPTTAKDQSRIHQFGKKVLPGLFLRYSLYAGWIWKGDVLVADIEELETMDASEIYSKRLNAKEVTFPKENGNFIFPVADGRIKLLGGDQDLRTSTLTRDRPNWGESHIDFPGESEGSLPQPRDSFPDAGEAINDFGPCQETSYTAITLNQESNFTRRERNHSLFHWSTLTFPELRTRIWMLSKRNASMIIGISMGQEICLTLVQVSLNLLYWKKTSRRVNVVREEIDEKTAHIQARSLMARTLGENGKNAKLKERQKWSHEKPQLDNARKLRGFFFIDPEDKEFKETIKNAGKELETPVVPAMPCKIMKKNCGRGASNKIKTRLACILEASESTRLRMGESLPNHHEDHIAGKGWQFTAALQFGSQIYSYAPSHENSCKQKQQWTRIGKNWRKFRRQTWRKSEVRKMETKHPKYKGRIVLRGDIVTDDSGSHAVFTEQGPSSSQMTAAKVMDIISRLPACAGQAADAVFAYSQVKKGGCSQIIQKFQYRNVQTFRFVYHDTNGQNHGPVWKITVVPLERNLYGHPLAGLSWERQFEKILLQHGWEKIPNWECLFVHREKGLFLSVYVDDIKLAGKKQNINPMWKVLNKEVDLGEPTSFLDHVFLGCIQRQCEITKDMVDNYRAMFESRISAGRTRKTSTLREFSFALSERLKNVSLVNTGTSFWKKKKITIERRDPLFALSERNWYPNNHMRSMGWKQLSGKTSWKYLSLVMNRSSVFNAQKICVFSDSVLCLGKLHENPQSNKAWEDRLTWFKSSPEYRNLWQNWWWGNGIRVEYLPQDSPRCSSATKSKSYCWDWVKHHKNSQDGLSSCRCSTTSHGDQETTRKNASQMLNSCLYLRKDSELDNGQFSDLDHRKSGFLSVKIVHKVNGRRWLSWWC